MRSGCWTEQCYAHKRQLQLAQVNYNGQPLDQSSPSTPWKVAAWRHDSSATATAKCKSLGHEKGLTS